MRYLLALLLTLVPGFAVAAPPNVVIFIGDDHGGGDLSCYGHPVLRTPHIDALAREGMRFDNAFLAISSCSPSRASTLTGRYPHSTHAEDLHQPLPADQKTLAYYLRPAGYHTVSVGKWHMGGPEKEKWDKVVECQAAELPANTIEQLRGRPKNKPFFFWVASIDPHRPYGNDAPAVHKPQDVVVPPYLPDHPKIRADLALYYDEVVRWDAAVGQIVAELKQQGVLNDTLIVFMSDNGMPFPRAKTTLYDSGIRTPFIVRYPPLVAADSVQKKLVSTVDLAPTILDLASVKQETMQGRSFIPMLRDPNASIREHVFAEANWHDFEQFTRAARSDRFLLIRNYYWDKPLWNSVDSINSQTWAGIMAMKEAGKLSEAQAAMLRDTQPYEEFYDTQADPHQLQNLIDTDRYRAELYHLRTQLDNWRVETDDRMPEKRELDGWTKDGAPLPHNQPWYDRYIKAGGKSSFEKF